MPVDEFWDEAEVERIIQSIRQPVFPNNPDVYVTQYGARWGATVLGADVAPPDMIDGTAFDSLPAFKAAIEVCSAAGGGRVVVPSGTYFVKGPITLKSNVNLHLQDEDTRIVFSRDPRDYPTVLTQYEANACMNYSPFLYARDAENIAVTGKGTFDGQAGIGDAGNTTGSRAWAFGQKSNPDVTPPVNMATTGAWLAWKAFTAGTAPRNDIHDDGRLKNSANDDTYVPWADRVFGRDPSFGWEFEHGRKMSTLRPNFVGFWNCQRVLIEGVKFRRSPMWVIAPVLCSEVTVRGVYVESHGTNNDGVNPVCSSQVLIEDCELDTGDDCVAIKSGRGGDGYNFTPDGKGGPRPSHDIVVRNCVLSDGHGAITLGSEISGGVYNVFAENITMKSSAVYAALRLKTNSGLGGSIRNIYMRNIDMQKGVNRSASYGVLLIDANYNGVASPALSGGGVRTYAIENIYADNIYTTEPIPVPIFISGFRPDLGYEGLLPATPPMLGDKMCVIKNINLRNSSFGGTTTTTTPASNPAGTADVAYAYGDRSGAAGSTRYLAKPDGTPGLEAPTLINVTVNGVDRSTAS